MQTVSGLERARGKTTYITFDSPNLPVILLQEQLIVGDSAVLLASQRCRSLIVDISIFESLDKSVQVGR